MTESTAAASGDRAAAIAVAGGRGSRTGLVVGARRRATRPPRPRRRPAVPAALPAPEQGWETEPPELKLHAPLAPLAPRRPPGRRLRPGAVGLAEGGVVIGLALVVIAAPEPWGWVADAGAGTDEAALEDAVAGALRGVRAAGGEARLDDLVASALRGVWRALG